MSEAYSCLLQLALGGRVPRRMRAEAAAPEMTEIGGASPFDRSPFHPQPIQQSVPNDGISPSYSDATSRVLLESSTEEAMKESRPTDEGERDESSPPCLKEVGSV